MPGRQRPTGAVPSKGGRAATFQQIADFRLRRHHLRDATPADAITICRDICGVQAQIMSAAYLQLWARNHAITRSEVEDTLWKSRTLVKTSLMRQTLHLIPADEFSLYVTAVKSSRVAAVLRIMARFGITREEADALSDTIVDVLSSGPLARAAILAAVRPRVSRRVRAWMDKVWSILRIPVAEGRICYGPGEGNQVKFICVGDWLPKLALISEIDAQCALFRKYLRAYGPASVSDFSHWSGISVRECRLIHQQLKDELVPVTAEGETRLMLAEDRPALSRSSRSETTVNLLPNFDAYLLAHAEKHHLIEGRHYKRVYRNQGWISPVILLDGKIVATWSYKTDGGKLAVRIDPFEKLSRVLSSRVADEAASLARFFAKELAIQWAT